jgi:hypothetical protein
MVARFDGAAHNPAMSDTTSAAGWVVQVTIPGVPIVQAQGSRWRPATSTAPTFQFFNVAIGSADKAVEAARKKAGASEEVAIRTVRSLSSAEIAAIPLRTGETKPA